MLLLVALACTQPGTEADDVCAGEYKIGVGDDDARVVGLQVPSDDGTYTIHVDLRWPLAAPERDQTWPVVVVIQGGWDQEGTPVTADTARPEPGDGLVALHVDLPGHGRSGGTNDRRGEESRTALATVMRYAAGLVTDYEGCDVVSRTRSVATDRLYLMGLSNGGNMAVAELADPTLDLPTVSGLITWETPASPVFVNVELGKEDKMVYTPGDCALTDTEGITCGFDEEQLAYSDNTLCIDMDGDAACGDDDISEVGSEDPETGLAMVSPSLRRAADDRGFPMTGFATTEAATEWWATRNAALQAPELVAARPELPVMIVASEDDHVLTNYTDHPNVYGWGEALQKAGAFWTRLNPGSEWIEGWDTPNEPNATMSLANPDLNVLTEAAEDPLEHTLAAAVLELDQRVQTDDWE